MDEGVVSKLLMEFREQLGKREGWEPVEKKGNPCSSVLVESYLTFVTEEQKRVGVPVKQAAPMLVPTLAQLFQDMRVRAQLTASVSDRIAIARDIALYSAAFHSMRRGLDLSFHVGFAALAAAGVRRADF